MRESVAGEIAGEGDAGAGAPMKFRSNHVEFDRPQLACVPHLRGQKQAVREGGSIGMRENPVKRRDFDAVERFYPSAAAEKFQISL